MREISPYAEDAIPIPSSKHYEDALTIWIVNKDTVVAGIVLHNQTIPPVTPKP